MPMQLSASPWSAGFQPSKGWQGKGAPTPQGYGQAPGPHRQYAGYMGDRDTLFYVRGLRRRGFDFGDPYLMLLAEATLECDVLPCPDDLIWP